MAPHQPRPSARRRLVSTLLATTLSITFAGTALARTADEPGIPPAVDPGTPDYIGSADPVPAEPATFDPRKSQLKRIFDADVAAGGTSYWMDRLLARPAGKSGGNNLYSRGRALYMNSHTPGTLGFAGGYAYREQPTGSAQTLYSITVSGTTLTEVTDDRRQYPSYWSSVHTGGDLRVQQRKFITNDNVAVDNLDLTNTGAAPLTRTLTLASSRVSTPVGTTELTGTVQARYDLTTLTPRLSGDGFTVASPTTLTRTVTLEPGQTVSLKTQLGMTARELPESDSEYVRYRGYSPMDAWKKHLWEYNKWWADNVPYIDVPDQNVKKMSYYRTFLNRFNYVDANIPGNDYQFPVSVEGALGYNNAVQLTQPMHIQDLKYFRDPLYSYGNWVTSGETSKCDAFISNPGSFSWGNTYEQYIGREAWNAFKVHGGDPKVIRNFAKYAECDVKGQLNKYDSDGNYLVEYNVGFLTGNDADAVPFRWAPGRQDRVETAFWYSGAKASADAYAAIGDTAKAAELNQLAQHIKDAIMNVLWDDGPADTPPLQPAPATRSAGQTGFGTALKLNGTEPNRQVNLPAGIVSGLTDFTVATWVNRATTSGQTWSRVWDFGTGAAVNMFLTVNAGGAGLRFAITTNGGGAEQQVTAAPQLPTGWNHVAVTKSGSTVTLYLNGQPVGTNPNVTLSPSSMGNTTNNWIGRSQYGDPLLDATVDDFQIYDNALTQAQVQALLTAPGTGNVASYNFDDTGNTVTDASGNGRNGTIETPLVGERPGKTFKHRHVATNALIPWKDQQVFMPFVEGIPPNTDNYKQALRYYTDAKQFPIMPFYTANQTDQAEAGSGGTNNFSNINSTLQAQVFAKAIREYPSQYVTPQMYRKLLEWLTWVQYIDGDNQFPDNNEFFFDWDPETRTLGRSGIHHDILGGYNFMLIDDIAGVRPRLDEQLELWPIDVGYEYFTVNNLSYHGKDLTVVWDKPDGSTHYAGVPEGFSAYVDGQHAFTVDGLAHLTWDSKNGKVKILDGSGTAIRYDDEEIRVPKATDIRLRDNARVVDMFQKAGADISRTTGNDPNLAEGRPVTASFTTTTPALRVTDPKYAVDGFTISGLPANGPAGQARTGYLAPNTIWGTEGSPNAQDWLEVDLGGKQVDTVKLYFFNDKNYDTQQNCSPRPCANTYREPASYTVQYLDGAVWKDVPRQKRSPDVPLANYNKVEFKDITVGKLRVLMTPKQKTATTNYGIGIKEIQVFES